ncbi:HPP family protein [Devosia sp. RR2S18]|uniref:HPP family protein n=1 Tax=Devosia rhizosphaerae TaxID=3049774 RepID=UPI0025400B58|nr:HPP family protein [Devosia sp. RR2S18]WIJ26401.1 HPP family protein [Devosia sp. RR2S18]
MLRLALLNQLLPNLVPVSGQERLRAALGAFAGILVTGIVTAAAVGSDAGTPLLMAPIGASAVLLFAVPTSPLAQPWSILAGNCLAALVGVTAAILIPQPLVAAAFAVAVSIGLMLTCRCLHPPSGAVALTAVIGGPAITELGYGFILWPVGLNSVLLLLLALLFNKLTGKEYPHRPSPSVGSGGGGSLGVTIEDLTTAIKERDEVVPIDPADLDEVLQRAEAMAFSRRSGGVTAGSIMSREVITVAPATTLRVCLRLLRSHGLKALPVVEDDRTVVGILTATDLLEKADWGPAPVATGLGWRLRAKTNSDRPLRGKARELMSAQVRCVSQAMPIARVVQVMAETGHHHLPVLDDQGILIGVVTQSDVLSALFHVNAEELALTA